MVKEKNVITAYGNFAIPHAMKMEAKKTGIHIIISNRPIKWGEKYVQIEFLQCALMLMNVLSLIKYLSQ